MTSTNRLYRAQHASPVRQRPEPAADPRAKLPSLWACLRDGNGRLHYVSRREVDMINVLTSAVYGWKEVR